MEGRRVIGVVGGMGPLATFAFCMTVLEQTVAATDQEHLHLIVDSDTSIPDRTAFLLNGGLDPRPALFASARRLRDAGADLLVMPCNSANVWAQEVAEAGGLPLVNWLEVTADFVAELRLHSVALLATDGTVKTGIYQELLRGRGVETVLPTIAEQADVMSVIYGPHGVKTLNRRSADAAATLRRLIRILSTRGAEAVLLACTELPIALDPENVVLPITVIDPATVVARQVVQQAGGSIRGMPGRQAAATTAQ